MIANIIWIIIINLVMINIWIRFIRSHFGHLNSFKFFVLSVLSGLCSVIFLYGSHYLIDRVNFKSLLDPLLLSTSLNTLLFVIIGHCILSIIFVILTNRNFGQLQVILVIRATVIIVMMSGLSIVATSSSIIVYYLFVALSEEYIKSLGAYTRFSRYRVMLSDIIVFTLITSLGFACIENIIHLGSQLTQLWASQILAQTSLIVTKGIASTMMHLFFTSFFAMLYLQYSYSPSLSLRLIITGILSAVLIHRSYDLILYYGYWWIVIVYSVIGYFWLTYILYHSQRLYIDPDTLQHLQDPQSDT